MAGRRRKIKIEDDEAELSEVKRAYPGFPKRLPCLICGRPKKSKWPGDRIHAYCKKARLALISDDIEHRARLATTQGGAVGGDV